MTPTRRRRSLVRSAAHLAADKLADEALYLPEKPDDERAPRLPEDLTALNDQGLIGLMTQLTTWGAYAAGKLSMAEVEERELTEALDLKQAEGVITGWEGQATDARVAVAKARAATDPDVIKSKEKLLQVYARRKILQQLVDRLDRDAALVSRELTRRVGAEPRERRTRRWDGGS